MLSPPHIEPVHKVTWKLAMVSLNIYENKTN